MNVEGGASNTGVSVWFDTLDEMADPVAQLAVQDLINTMITAHPLMKDATYSIAAKLAASLLTNQIAAQVKPQADYAIELDKQAMSDLEKLIRTPFFDGAVTSVKETKLAEGKLVKLYLALDINNDFATYNATNNSGVTYTGVPGTVGAKVGEAVLWTGFKVLDNIVVDVLGGDTPGRILYRIEQEWRNKQTINNTSSTPFIPVTLGANEGRPVTGSRTIDYLNYPALTFNSTQSPSVTATLGYLQVTPYLYDKSVDFINFTLQLFSETVPGNLNFSKPGIPGLLYGDIGQYSGLTVEGPHSVMLDLQTGERTSLEPTTTSESSLSDTFYFQIVDPGSAAYGLVNITGTVADTDQFDVVLGGTTYSFTAGPTDVVADVVNGLIAVIDPLTDFSAISPLAGQVKITDVRVTGSPAVTVGSLGNTITLTVSTTSSTAFITASGATLTNGRDANTLPSNGTVTFRSQEMIDTLNPVPISVNRTRTVNVTTGMTAIQVVSAIANDIATFSATSRLLGALRAPTKFVIQGTPSYAPGLTIVPYTRDEVHYNVVFDILTVPAALTFAVVPKSFISTDLAYTFDNQAKSVIVPAKFFNPTSVSTQPTSLTATDNGKVYISEPKISKRLSKVFKCIDDFNKDFQ
jgi:hypothetical protein